MSHVTTRGLDLHRELGYAPMTVSMFVITTVVIYVRYRLAGRRRLI